MNPHDAINTLADCCANKTGQGYKLRALLYSLWNGKPASLLEIVTLDRNLRLCLLTVMEHFGEPTFFYEEIKSAFNKRGLFLWFCDEGEEK
jgi:hypothetical protein